MKRPKPDFSLRTRSPLTLPLAEGRQRAQARASEPRSVLRHRCPALSELLCAFPRPRTRGKEHEDLTTHLVFPGCIAFGLTRAPRSRAARGLVLPPCGRNRNYRRAETLKESSYLLVILSIDPEWNLEWLVCCNSLWFIRSHSATFRRKYYNFTRTLAF